MKIKIKLLPILTFCVFKLVFYCDSAAQQNVIDSLKQKITTAANSKDKVESLRLLVDVLGKNSSNEKSRYLEELISTAELSKNNSALSYAYRQKAVSKRNSNESDSAFYFINAASNYSSLSKNNFEEASNLNTLAALYGQKGLFDSSLYCYKRAIEMKLNGSDLQLRAIAYSGISQRTLDANKYSEALQFADSAIYILKSINDEKRLSSPYRQKANIYNTMSSYDSAIVYTNEMIRIAEKYRDFSGTADGYLMEGRIYKLLNENHKAEASFKKALSLAESNNLNSNLTFIINDIINLYRKTKQDDSLYVYLEIFKNKFSNIISKDYRILNVMGSFYFDKKEYLMAKEIFLQIQEFLSKGGRERDLMYNDWHLGITYDKMNRRDSALFYMKRYLAKAESGGSPEEERKANSVLALFYEDHQEFKIALQHHKKYNELSDIILTNEKLKSIAEIETRYETGKKEQQIIQLESQKKLNETELQLRNEALLKVQLLNQQKSQKLILISKENDINRLAAREKALALENQKKETEKRQQQLLLSQKETELKSVQLSKASLKQKFTIAGVALIVLSSGYGFYNYRRRKSLEGQQALANERLRISRELHDDIGSTLGSIAVYSDVAKNRSVKNENSAEVLSKIGTASRELIEKMSDIVWSLNPENESTSQLLNRMQAFTAMILTPRNILIEFKADDELKSMQLTSEQRKNIFLIYKEAVHNIVKYAECKNVLISISKSNNNLVLVIKDDGIGFDINNHTAYNGNGLKNMKLRADEIHGELVIISNVNQGTNVELKFTVT